MNWIKFMMVDFRLVKRQMLFFIVFPAFVIFMGVSGSDMIFLITYLCFGVLVLSTTPFTMEDKSISSFVQLLPGRDRDKVLGRFSWFLVLLLAFSIYGFGLSYVMSRFGIGEIRILEYDYYFCVLAVLVSLIIGCIQMTIFYQFGRMKSQQILNLIRMLPAFLFFFLSNYVSDNVMGVLSGGAGKTTGYEFMRNLIEHKDVVLLAGLGVAVLIFIAGVALSTYRVSRRDVSVV